jgi:hypothetical protein
MTRYFAGGLPDDQWRRLLTYCLTQADSFTAHFPDGPGMLSYGRDQFLALPGVDVGPWAGMRESTEVAGPLTPESIRPCSGPTAYRPKPGIWLNASCGPSGWITWAVAG